MLRIGEARTYEVVLAPGARLVFRELDGAAQLAGLVAYTEALPRDREATSEERGRAWLEQLIVECRATVAAIEGIADIDGSLVPSTPDGIERVLRAVPGAAAAVVAARATFAAALAEQEKKQSSISPSG